MSPLIYIQLFAFPFIMTVFLIILIVKFVDKEGKQMLLTLLIKTIIVVAEICFLIWFANQEVLKWFL